MEEVINWNKSFKSQKFLNESAERMFGDQQTGLAKQVLNIALCECQGDNSNAYIYFSSSSNFELVVKLNPEFQEEKAKAYFDSLLNQIKSHDLTAIRFKQTNDFFQPNESGFEPNQLNK